VTGTGGSSTTTGMCPLQGMGTGLSSFPTPWTALYRDGSTGTFRGEDPIPLRWKPCSSPTGPRHACNGSHPGGPRPGKLLPLPQSGQGAYGLLEQGYTGKRMLERGVSRRRRGWENPRTGLASSGVRGGSDYRPDRNPSISFEARAMRSPTVRSSFSGSPPRSHIKDTLCTCTPKTSSRRARVAPLLTSTFRRSP